MRTASLVMLGVVLVLQRVDGAPDWTTQCNSRVADAANDTSSPYHGLVELVDGAGRIQPLDSNITHSTFGISEESCHTLCGDIGSTFSFTNFSQAATNWLLPWVALSAQLPYETAGPFNNVMSVLFAIGSPAFITYGLIITMLNRFQIAERFTELVEMAKESFVYQAYPGLRHRLEAAEMLLQESQQAPMRASDEHGWFSSLVALEANQAWWLSVKQHLNNTRRGVTVSLILQLLFAVVAWLFTVIAAFEDVGDVVTALSISSSSIWLWMVPVVTGWVAVGTQIRSRAVYDAVHMNNAETRRAPEAQGEPTEGYQDGIRCQSGLTSHVVRLETDADVELAERPTPDQQQVGVVMPLELTPAASGQTSTTAVNDPLTGVPASAKADADRLASSRLPTFWGFSLLGEEAKEGPIFNYARVFTSAKFSNVTIEAFRAMIEQIRSRRAVDGANCQPGQSIKVVGTTDQLSAYIGSPNTSRPYSPWREIPGKTWQNIIIASLIAILVQWGTTGPSIMIAYLTPTIGLGCRSGSYLLYGGLATLVWVLMVMSSLQSHALMLRCQAGIKPKGLLPILYVFTRVAGYILAASNAAWLVLSSIFELSGYFDGCFCNSDFLSLRHNGWILLFKKADDLAPYAEKTWVGGIAFGAVICFIATLIMWLGCKQTRR